MTCSTARANRRSQRNRRNQRDRRDRPIWRPTETDLGGRPGDPVDIRTFSPAETAARILGGELTPELVEQVEMGSEFLQRANRGEHPCIFCRKPLTGLVARISWLETPRGTKRAVFGICEECNGPDVKQRLIERLRATEMAIH
jgi:hypothetical protein